MLSSELLPTRARGFGMSVLLPSNLDCLICGLDCLICGLDCLICGLDCLVCVEFALLGVSRRAPQHALVGASPHPRARLRHVGTTLYLALIVLLTVLESGLDCLDCLKFWP